MIRDLKALTRRLEESVRAFTDVAVVGISGGVDSAVVASVAVAALGSKHVYLLSMPFDDTDRQTFNRRSTELADFLKANHLTVGIGNATNALLEEFGEEFSAKLSQAGELHRLTTGNTRARMRMALLYALAGELSYRFHEQPQAPGAEPVDMKHSRPRRVRVLGTGNASEDLIGYDTKGGDALADLFIIGDLFKSEVYELARHYNVPRSIQEAAPSAGLYQGQTDAQELGYSYDELEPALRALHRVTARHLPDSEISPGLPEFSKVERKHAEFVIRRFQANAHKHRAPAVVSVRSTGLVE